MDLKYLRAGWMRVTEVFHSPPLFSGQCEGAGCACLSPHAEVKGQVTGSVLSFQYVRSED